MKVKKQLPLRQAKLLLKILIASVLLLFCAFSAFAQVPTTIPLPKKIRGYKVHNETIGITLPSTGDAKTERAVVELDDPELNDVSLSGVTFSLNAEITSLEQSGSIDILSFNDFLVNGIPVTIADLDENFTFRKNEAFRLPKPAKIQLSTTGVLRAAWKELREQKKKWLITGRIFIFGKFRRYGLSFKRVVPVDVSIEIDNPLLDK